MDDPTRQAAIRWLNAAIAEATDIRDDANSQVRKYQDMLWDVENLHSEIPDEIKGYIGKYLEREGEGDSDGH